MRRSLAWLAGVTIWAAAACGGASDNAFPPAPADEGGVEASAPPPPADSGVDSAAPIGFLSASGIDFGLVDCGGGAPDAKSITVKNLGALPLTWSAALSASEVFKIAGASS